MLKVNGLWQEFATELYGEVGDENLVDSYLNGFVDTTSGGDVQEASRLVYEVTLTHWGPVIQAFVKWVFDTTPDDANLVLLLRDSWPFGKVVQRQMLAQHRHREVTPLYLSRAMLGIEDEAGEDNVAAQRELLRQYMEPLFKPNTVVVDTGCYGTILVDLFRRFGLRLQSRFFFAHNPWIPSFLGILGVPPEIAEMLNDTIEVLLVKRHKRVKHLVHSDNLGKEHGNVLPYFQKLVEMNGCGVVPILSQTCYLGYVLHEATKMGIFHSRLPTQRELLGILRSMAEKHVLTRETGTWTGFLPSSTPTWSGGKAFLADYPAELKDINPRHLLPEGYDPRRPMVNIKTL